MSGEYALISPEYVPFFYRTALMPVHNATTLADA
jgi:hypothetical protein